MNKQTLGRAEQLGLRIMMWVARWLLRKSLDADLTREVSELQQQLYILHHNTDSRPHLYGECKETHDED